MGVILGFAVPQACRGQVLFFFFFFSTLLAMAALGWGTSQGHSPGMLRFQFCPDLRGSLSVAYLIKLPNVKSDRFLEEGSGNDG